MKIFVDPGHGGTDPGAVNQALGLKEADVNLDVAVRLNNILQARGFQTMMSRSSDIYVSLTERTNMANNWGADYYISVHCNANENRSITGTECYYYRTGTTSVALAEAVNDQMVMATGLPDRGTKAANFAVLRQSKMPAILDEMAFISNPNEAYLLSTVDFRQTCAQAIADGFQVFFENRAR